MGQVWDGRVASGSQTGDAPWQFVAAHRRGEQVRQNDTSSPMVGRAGNMLMPERMGGELSKL